MTCRQVQRVADEIAAGAADAESRETAKRHAESCEDCALVLERAEILGELLDYGREELRAPASLGDAIRGRLEQQSVRPYAWRLSRAWLTSPAARLAACAGIAILVATLTIGRGPEPPSASPTAVARPSRLADRSIAPESPAVFEALQSAADTNRDADAFADSNVVELAQVHASDLATACLEM
jgi:hypothetical protein